MSTAILACDLTVHSNPSTETTAGLRGPIKTFPPQVEVAMKRVKAAAPPLSTASRDRLVVILGGAA